MLLSRTIIPSVNPYASLVLLVKEKDGTWRFCIGYRRLNATTINSRFRIPIVDELMDGLVGTKILQVGFES
jgi:hypothetical protein